MDYEKIGYSPQLIHKQGPIAQQQGQDAFRFDGRFLDTGIQGANIQDSSVTTQKLAGGAVTSQKLAEHSVMGTHTGGGTAFFNAITGTLNGTVYIDVTNRQLFSDNLVGTPAVDWSSGVLNRFDFGNPSLDWSNSLLEYNGTRTVDWASCFLVDDISGDAVFQWRTNGAGTVGVNRIISTRDIEFGASQGIILQSSNGIRVRITLGTNGSLSLGTL